MKRVIDTSEALGTVEMPQGVCQLCASADARFDEEAGWLVMKLETFLRPTDLLVKARRFRAGWLPENEVVAESVAREEWHEVARQTFHRWVRKVRKTVPPLPFALRWASSRRRRNIALGSRPEGATHERLKQLVGYRRLKDFRKQPDGTTHC
jgi:hypothetical protein